MLDRPPYIIFLYKNDDDYFLFCLLKIKSAFSSLKCLEIISATFFQFTNNNMFHKLNKHNGDHLVCVKYCSKLII